MALQPPPTSLPSVGVLRAIRRCACVAEPPPSPVAAPRPQALGVNDDSLFGVLIIVTLGVGYAFAQWQAYQDDDEEDFFDTYESRRVDRVSSNRNRV